MRDHGPGIAAHERLRAFAQYYRSSEETGGSGLGLAIGHEIVDLHRGPSISRPPAAAVRM